MLKIQNSVPEIYVEESRDFQMFCRVYDCVVNGVKYDIDSINYLSDTSTCKTDILQLLQTKLGFFTQKKIDDTTLRYILEVFPLLVKNKGSLKGIEQAINTFLKINGIRSSIVVWLVEQDSMVYNTAISDHTIVVGINSALKNLDILQEVFKYILPTGFGIFFYFFTSISDYDPFKSEDSAKMLYISDDINSILRGSDITYSNEFENRVITAVDTAEVMSPSDFATETYNTQIKVEKELSEE